MCINWRVQPCDFVEAELERAIGQPEMVSIQLQGCHGHGIVMEFFNQRKSHRQCLLFSRWVQCLACQRVHVFTTLTWIWKQKKLRVSSKHWHMPHIQQYWMWKHYLWPCLWWIEKQLTWSWHSNGASVICTRTHIFSCENLIAVLSKDHA